MNNGEAKSVRELVEVLRREAKAIFDEEFNAELMMGGFMDLRR